MKIEIGELKVELSVQELIALVVALKSQQEDKPEDNTDLDCLDDPEEEDPIEKMIMIKNGERVIHESDAWELMHQVYDTLEECYPELSDQQERYNAAGEIMCALAKDYNIKWVIPDMDGDE